VQWQLGYHFSGSQQRLLVSKTLLMLESVEVADADLGVGTDDDDDNEVEPIAFGAMNMEDILEGVAVWGELNTEPQMSVEDIGAGLAGA